MAYFNSLGHSVPDQVITNQALTGLMDTSDEWIRQRSGIAERRWARCGENTSGTTSNSMMAIEACRQALNSAGVLPSQVDGVCYATITPDREFPGNGAAVVAGLGIARGIPVFEVRNQCAGFLYALYIARTYIDSGAWHNALVIGVELQSSGLNISTDGRDTAVLFGDGGGAVLLSSGGQTGQGIIAASFESDGKFADKLGLAAPGFAHERYLSEGDFDGPQAPAYPRMDGRLVFKMASIRMPEIVRRVVREAGHQLDDLDLIIPHQANQRILDMLAAELKCRAPVFSNIARYGNTTAGSIPLALAEAQAGGHIRRGDLVCLVSFGAGFSWGAMVVRW